MITYGTNDQLPWNGVGLVLEQAEPADGDEHHAEADEQRAGDPEADDPPSDLSGSVVSCLK